MHQKHGCGSSTRVAVTAVVLLIGTPAAIDVALGNDEPARRKRSWEIKDSIKLGQGEIVTHDELVGLSSRINRTMRKTTAGKTIAPQPAQLGQLLQSGRVAKTTLASAAARSRLPDSGWEVTWNETNGTPAFITSERPASSGKLVPLADLGASVDRLALEFVEEHRSLFRLEQPRDELRLQHSWSDRLGRHHASFQQRYQGLPVWNHDVVVHLDPSGQMYAVNARYAPTPRQFVSTVPDISAAEAIAVAAAALSERSVVEELRPWARQLLKYDGPTATRCMWADPTGTTLHLVWHVETRPNWRDRWYSFVDAHSGDVLLQYNATNSDGPVTAEALDLNGDVQTVNIYEDQDVFLMIDASRPMFRAEQPINFSDPRGVIWTIDAQGTDLGDQSLSQIVSEDNVWRDPVAVSAHSNAGKVFDYFLNTHGRLAIDDDGSTIISIVHVTEDGEPLVNAFWNGAFMAYGDGGNGVRPLAAGLDVAAHELTHGIIQRTVNLEYAFQSGALNESLADVFGAMVDRDDWLIGEDVIDTDQLAIDALRDMAEPSRRGQPGHMDEFVELGIDVDNGGVHINSGIPNRACFLIAEAIGREKTEQIYYRIMDSRYLNSKSNFSDMRQATMRAAVDLFGDPSNELGAVVTAFDEVGIVGEGGLEAPADIVVRPGEEWVLLVNAEENDNSLYLARPSIESDDDIVQLSSTQVYSVTGNSVTVAADGSFILFVDISNNLRIISPDGTDEEVIDDLGLWSSIALSPDGRKLALTTTRRENIIFILDLVDADASTAVFLYSPTTQDDVEADVTQFADAMDWDPNSEFLIYDAFNSIPTGDGESLDYWDVNILIADSDVIIPLFPPQPAGFHLGNPSFANTNETFVVFDFYDEQEEMNTIWVYDLFAGEASPIETTGSYYSFPSFSPDDGELIFEVFDEERETLTISRVPLQPGRLERAGPTQPYLLEAQSAKWFTIVGDDFETAVEDVEETQLPLETSLQQNYPNPFNAGTTLPYHLSRAGEASLVIHDLAGQRVAELDLGFRPAGSYTTRWRGVDGEGRPLASGVYFYTLVSATAGDETVATRKLVLLR